MTDRVFTYMAMSLATSALQGIARIRRPPGGPGWGEAFWMLSSIAFAAMAFVELVDAVWPVRP